MKQVQYNEYLVSTYNLVLKHHHGISNNDVETHSTVFSCLGDNVYRKILNGLIYGLYQGRSCIPYIDPNVNIHLQHMMPLSICLIKEP